MAVLSNGLEWVLKANTSSLDKAIDQSKKKVGELEKETKKSGDGMSKSFFGAKESLEKLRSAMLFYGAAVAALVVPTLQFEKGMKKLQGAALLAGKTIGGPELVGAVKKAADAMGKTYAGAATDAAAAVTRFSTDAVSALKLVTQASNLEKLGFGTQAQNMEALGSAAKAASIPLGEFADTMSSKLLVASRIAGENFQTFLQAFTQLAPIAKAGNVDFDVLAGTMASMVAQGVPLAETVSTIETAIRAAIKPTEEQAAAWESMGLNMNQAGIAGDRLPGVLDLIAANAANGNTKVGALTGNVDALTSSFKSFSAGDMPGVMAKIADSSQLQAQAMEASKSTMDKMAEALNKILNALTPISGLFESITQATEGWGTALGVAWATIKNIVSDLGGGIMDKLFQFGFDIGNSPATNHYQTGGWIPGFGSGDKIPAMLEPGEFVMKKSIAQQAPWFMQMLNSGQFKPGLLQSMMMGQQGQFGYGPDAAMRISRFGRLPWERSPMLGSANPLLGSSMGYGFGGSGMKYPWKFASGGSVPNPTPGERRMIASLDRLGGVRRMAAGGPVSIPVTPTHAEHGNPIGSSHDIHIGTVNMQFRGSDISPTFIRDKVKPALEREAQGGRSRRARTGR